MSIPTLNTLGLSDFPPIFVTGSVDNDEPKK